LAATKGLRSLGSYLQALANLPKIRRSALGEVAIETIAQGSLEVPDSKAGSLAPSGWKALKRPFLFPGLGDKLQEDLVVPTPTVNGLGHSPQLSGTSVGAYLLGNLHHRAVMDLNRLNLQQGHRQPILADRAL
jgi:hypothetical protein